MSRLRDALSAEILEQRRCIALYDKLYEHLAKFNGKTYSKRIETHIQKCLGDEYSVYLQYTASLVYLNIIKRGEQDWTRFHLGYSDRLFSIPQFQICSAYHGDAERERLIVNLKVTDETLDLIERTYKELKSLEHKLDAMLDKIPAQYALKKVLDDTSKI